MKRFSKWFVVGTLFLGALVSMDVLSPNSAEAGCCRRARRCCRPRRCCQDTCCPAPCPAPCAGPVCCG